MGKRSEGKGDEEYDGEREIGMRGKKWLRTLLHT